jgi:hypothetical protein
MVLSQHYCHLGGVLGEHSIRLFIFCNARCRACAGLGTTLFFSCYCQPATELTEAK